MKKGKKILTGILLLLAAAAACMCVYWYPVWASAKILQEKMDLVHFAYEIEAELAREELPEEQAGQLAAFAKLTGVEPDAMYHFTIKGSVWEDKIHGLVYPEGAEDALLEFYLSDDTKIINEAVLYNAIRNNVAAQNVFLEFVFPVEKEDVYMTLEQVEQIFQVDLESIRSFRLPFGNRELTAKQYFFALAVMEREKQEGGSRFELATEQAQIRLDLPDGGNSSGLNIQINVQEPAEAFLREEELLSKLGVELRTEQLRMLDSIAITIEAGEGNEIVMPDNFVSQKTVDFLSQLREFLEKLSPHDI